MKRLTIIVAGLLALAVAGCGHVLVGNGWVTLIDGDKGLDNFNRVGSADWHAEGGAIVADKSATPGNSFLVSKESYRDFEVHAEFYSAPGTNSGIYLRCANPKEITDRSCYEVNIFDTRPDPIYSTGAITNFAAVPVPPVHKADGRWNTYDITARGPEVTVVFNGQVTVYLRDSQLAEGPFALQYAGGAIKWRKFEVRRL